MIRFYNDVVKIMMGASLILNDVSNGFIKRLNSTEESTIHEPLQRRGDLTIADCMLK